MLFLDLVESKPPSRLLQLQGVSVATSIHSVNVSCKKKSLTSVFIALLDSTDSLTD